MFISSSIKYHFHLHCPSQDAYVGRLFLLEGIRELISHHNEERVRVARVFTVDITHHLSRVMLLQPSTIGAN